MGPIVTLDLLEDELVAVARAGEYASGDEVVRHALDFLLTANPQLRARAAMDLFGTGKVTLARAAEIAGLDQETFKRRLAEVGVSMVVDEPAEQVRAGAEHIGRLRGRS